MISGEAVDEGAMAWCSGVAPLTEMGPRNAVIGCTAVSIVSAAECTAASSMSASPLCAMSHSNTIGVFIVLHIINAFSTRLAGNPIDTSISIRDANADALLPCADSASARSTSIVAKDVSVFAAAECRAVLPLMFATQEAPGQPDTISAIIASAGPPLR